MFSLHIQFSRMEENLKYIKRVFDNLSGYVAFPLPLLAGMKEEMLPIGRQ